MIDRQIIMEICDESTDLLHVADLIGEQNTLYLLNGMEGEVDHEAANGYVLEIVVRRKCVKL